MANPNFVDQGRADGAIFGRYTGKIGFFGGTGATASVPGTLYAQISGASQAAVTTTAMATITTAAATLSGFAGFVTTTQANAVTSFVNLAATRLDALTTLANSLRAAMVSYNLIAGA